MPRKNLSGVRILIEAHSQLSGNVSRATKASPSQTAFSLTVERTS